MGLAQGHPAGQLWSQASTTEPAQASLCTIPTPPIHQSLHPNSDVSWSLYFPHRKAGRLLFLAGTWWGKAKLRMETGTFLGRCTNAPGCRARAPTRTFGQLIAKAQPPPSLCTISTVGEWKAMQGSPEAGSEVSFHIPPFAPNRVQVPYGEQLLYLSPTVCPRPGITVFVRLENTYYAPSPPGALPLT